MIDIHCHILPGVDDGSPDLETSIEMARIAAKDGVTHIAATPHVYSPEFTPGMIMERTKKVNQVFVKLGIPVKVVPGAEVVTSLHTEIIKKYSINGKGYILLEFPHSHMPINAKEVIRNLSIDSYKPIIAHPERNPTIIKKPDVLVDIVAETGACVQITADSVAGVFGRGVRSCAKYLLKKRVVSVIASDAHSSGFRNTVLSKGLEAAASIIGEEAAEKLVKDNPGAIIMGRDII